MARLELQSVDENINLNLIDPLANININVDDSKQFVTLYLDNIVGIKVNDASLGAGELISQDADNLIHQGTDGLLAVTDRTDYLAYYLLAKS